MRSTRRARQTIVAAAASVLLAAGTVLAAAPASAAPLPVPATLTIAALGDSITQASMTCSSLVNCPANSWSTGTTSTVQSHLLRLRAAGSTVTAFNYSVAGAVASALPAQATKAAQQGATYVTIEIGANDACASSVSSMTTVASFTTSVQTSLATLSASSAKPEIFVASIPNIKRLWELNKSSIGARLAWAIYGNCKSMLANPTSTKIADVQRRDAVQQRVNEFNAALAAACAATAKCRWDGGAVANYQFTKADISTRDYFHPSTTGQATLARITWAKTQWVG